jgi:WD40 repeat protein
VRLWDVDSGEQLPAPDVRPEFIDELAVGAVGGHDALITGSRGGVLRLWDLADARPIAEVTLDAGIEGVWAVRGANTIAAMTADFQLHLFDVLTLTERP